MTSEESKESSDFKILVVEDSFHDFELMETALVAQFPCDVHLVMTKGQFEDELTHCKPDVIISDSNIPGFDGLAALQLAGDRCPDVPFVFCSGAPAEGPYKNKFPEGVDWVVKEDGFASLIAFVKKALKSKKATGET